MRTFKVFRDSNGRHRAVKQGWCWPAFFFWPIWVFLSGLWLPAILTLPLVLLIMVFTGVYSSTNAYDPYSEANQVLLAISLIPLAIKIMFGWGGNTWRAAKLERQGFSEIASLKARDKTQAIILAIGDAPPASSPPERAFASLAEPVRPVKPAAAPASSQNRIEQRPIMNDQIDPVESAVTRGGDTVRLAMAGVIGIAACFTLIGLVPVGIMLLGLVVSLKGGDRSALRTATGFISGFGIVLMVLSAGVWLYMTVPPTQSGNLGGYIGTGEDRFAALAVASLSLTAVLAVRFLWLNPLLRQFDALRAALFGIKIPDMPKREESQKLTVRDGLRTYSVADEIAKWHALRDQGVIDEAEYQQARNRLLKKD